VTVLRALLAPERRAPGDNGTYWGTWAGDTSAQTWAGPDISYGNAHQLLTVYGCVRFIADGISTLPIDVYTGSGDSAQPVTAPRWLEQPTVDLDRVEWMTQVLWSLLLAGNAYLRVVRSDASIVELQPIDPSTVQVGRERGVKVYRINGEQISGLNILHIKGVMAPGADIGMSPVEAARQNIGLGLAATEFGARFFDQNGTMGGVIEAPGEVPSDQARRWARDWARLHSGRKKAHLPGVLTGGATWKPTGVTNEQAQFLSTRMFTAAEIAAQMFLIDPTEFGVSADKGSSITYANLEQRQARRVTVTYLPWIIRVERALSSLLPRPRFVKINVNGLLRGDSKSRYDTYWLAEQINSSARGRGEKPLLTTQEMRSLEDLPPLPGPDPEPAPSGVPNA
jgi:HK97 family phage portal protein